MTKIDYPATWSCNQGPSRSTDEETATMTDLKTAALDPAERTRCEVWTRVMGYHRPVSAFNTGKRSEHADRCYFTENPRGTALREPQRAAA